MTLRVPPAGDVVDGAQQQIQTEPGAGGIGDGFGDHVADVPRHPGARVMRHRVGQLVGEGRGHISAGLASFLAEPLRKGPQRVIVSPFLFNRKTKSDLGWAFLGLIDGGRLKEYADDGTDITRIYRH
jgi:hypothetical protein